MRLSALTALILFASTAAAQPPQDMLAERVAALEGRVTALESRLSTFQPSRSPAPPHAAGPRRTYADAYGLALAEGKPLVVWSGSAVCPACVAETEGEFVNFVGSVPGYAGADALVAFVPDNGVLRRAGTITDWSVGDSVRGHVPSLRRAIQRWRESRQVTDTPVAASYQQSVMAPMMMGGGMGMGYGGPMMMSAGGGGCASCGSSGRAGLFRR